jgi:5-formaminoimidazole-4-carboxamide-1-(beta)-D-ribofuranosyl 5'-monophosphate synthetase
MGEPKSRGIKKRPSSKLEGVLEGYDAAKLRVATACSHSSLQIFHGARSEGLKTIGIAVGNEPKFYSAFPRARPDEFIVVDSWKDVPKVAGELREKNGIIVPHGSFVEYLGASEFVKLPVPSFGNRKVLAWESDREKQRDWLRSAGVWVPKRFKPGEPIDRPVLVKFHGAKGGRGYFIAKNQDEFMEMEDRVQGKAVQVQEYILGTRYYLQFFHSPLSEDGYRLTHGSLELLGMDRRDEANIDEMYKLGAQELLKKAGVLPTFVVTGNVPVVMRESLLPKVFDIGERIVERSYELFGGMTGPFCVETIVSDDLHITAFEISARIVAGTNVFVSGSPYSDFLEPGLSTGRRIAREIRLARKMKRIHEVIT